MQPASRPGEAEERYRKIFEAAEVGLWEEDYSEVRRELQRLRGQGARTSGTTSGGTPGK